VNLWSNAQRARAVVYNRSLTSPAVPGVDAPPGWTIFRRFVAGLHRRSILRISASDHFAEREAFGVAHVPVFRRQDTAISCEAAERLSLPVFPDSLRTPEPQAHTKPSACRLSRRVRH